MDFAAFFTSLRFSTLAWVGLGLFVLILLFKTLRYIPNTRVGIVEKLASAKGSVKKGLIALQDEAGFQPELLRGGWHVLTPFLYRIHKAEYARSQQQAAQIQILAGAEAEKVRLMGEGEAKRIKVMASAEAERAARVGVAQALAIEEQVRAYGGPQFQLMQQVMNRFAEAIEKSQVDVVPKIAMSGSNGGTGGLIESLLGLLLSQKVAEMAGVEGATPRDPAAEKLRKQMQETIERAG
jgi:uncharacterized membrane protein YqiK